MKLPADTLDEQLSAYMDGELPEAEARFLQRRLEHDAELRGKWARMQMASTCMKGQPWRPMSGNLCTKVSAELTQASPVRASRPLLRWAMAASVAALAVLLAPRLMQSGPEPVTAAATSAAAAQGPDHVVASPASADLVALNPANEPPTTPALSIGTSTPASEHDFISSNPEASAKTTPLPLSAQSPTDFPLIDSGDKRSWPRSELIGTSNDPALEAYLVRHNQMMANDGLGGFVPYVDVVASDQPATAADADDLGQNGEASQQ